MKAKIWRAALLCIILFTAARFCSPRLFAAPQQTPQFAPKVFQELTWRSIGPFRGGRSLAVTGVPGQPDLYYFGAVGGGVWRTDDAGRTWKPIFDSQPIASIGAVAVAPSNSQIIFVGSGEADMRSAISYGDGMYKSTDVGRTWAHIGLDDSRQIARILIDPRNPDRLFVAVLGHPYGPSAQRGVFRSNDGGATWQRVLFHDEDTGAIDLAFEPGNPSTIYAALWQTRRPPWNIYPPSNGPGSGLYRSTDSGDHWDHLTGHGLPSEGLGRIGIAFAPSNSHRIYLIIDAKDGGLYRSDDSGENWRRVSQDHRVWGRGWYFGEVTVDPRDPDTVYLPNTALYRSRDAGKTFTALKGAPGGDDYHELWIDPTDSRRMALSSDQGTVITRNSGETWSSWYNQPTGQMYHVITDNRFPYWVYGAQQDSGSIATPSRSNYRALNFHDWRPIEAGDENGYIAPDPLQPGVIFGGFVSRQNLENNQIAQIPPGLTAPEKLRRTWTLPLIFSPADPHTLYFGAQFLFRTSDGGSSWQAISPDLSREDPPAPPNLDPATIADAPQSQRRGVIYTIAPSPLKPAEIWAGTDDGLIHLTQNAGKTWSNVTPPELTPWSKVTHIEASHFDPALAYAAVDRHRLDDYQPYLYRTRDFGKSWQRLSAGIPDGSFLNCIREDPILPALLYACTEKGVYVSFDTGANWQSLQLNLPVTSVRDLVVHGDDLVIATHGRAFWLLDDMTLLRQLTPQVVSSQAWLFTPQTASRVRPGSDQGTPVPTDEPLAENPPSGAIIDYYFAEKPAAPVVLEITDSNGKLVRRFSSADEPQKIDPNSVPLAPNWIRNEPALSAEPGMHRFVWDLRYTPPQGARRSSFFGPAGPWALPGSYTVKLSAAQQNTSRPLIVKMDPRVTTPQSDLQRQFQLSSQLADALSEIAAARQQATALQKQIAARTKDASSNPELAQALAALDAKIAALLKSPEEAGFGFFGLSLPSGEPALPAVNSALSSLLTIVESADAAPSADAVAASQKWRDAAKSALARWQSLQPAGDRVNALLRKQNLVPLQFNPQPPSP